MTVLLPDLKPGTPRRVLIAGAPEGHDARLLAGLARAAGAAGLLHVATDDARAARLAEAVSFFDPGIEVILFPAWDCLPYDRVSPNGDIVARRIDALTRLLEPAAKDRALLLVTTVNAALHKVPPRLAFRNASFRARVGDRINLPELQRFLANNGYTKAQTVREPGEFAVRGGIVDLFPPGTAEPLRLDLFGDDLDGVRAFDPMTQLTTEKRDGFVLKPMSEVFLDEMSISRFRTGYRELFGAVTGDDPLYEAVSAGRKYAGMEHWLPLFHSGLETLFDYMPDAPVTLDPHVEEARDQRLEQVRDFFEARRTLQEAEKKSGNPVYRPVPPGMTVLDAEGWDLHLAVRPVAQLTPFAAAEAGSNPDLTDAGGRKGRDFADARVQSGVNVYDVLREHVGALLADGRRVVVAGYSTGARDRLRSVLKEHGIERVKAVESWAEVEGLPRTTTALVVLALDHGFTAPGLAVITEQDILGDRLVRAGGRKKRRAANFIAEASGLNPGDLVVHIDHGIGRYDGLETLDVGGAPHDCLRLVYEGGDKLYVPVENIEVLSRYGSEDSAGQLDRLGGAGWQSRKARVKKRLKDMAAALLRIAAERALRTAPPVAVPDGAWDEFCARFPYAETDDQLHAIEDVLGDLSSGRPMDRLVCGDVGFGKTEVALRAAFLAVMNGMQVAVVVPTTLLARQHYRTFEQRFAGLPVRLGQLSRLATAKETAQTKAGLADGTVDIVVGTHALLSKSVDFKRLGMVIVDEEQHFGVKQKERLKELRADIHVLTLTATPIPRTLQLALSGVRELSLIATPPVDRLAVRTFVLPYDPVVIREAILREHYRGGQSFYVCPRIEDLERVRLQLEELVPEVKVVVAHGQMPASQLEEVMTAFDEHKYDVLLATNIIESGLDIPSANTLVVHRADLFGLAQLYQVRGRVGRAKVRGYAYLTYQPRTVLSATAQQRLHVIETLDSLGAGFQLASHDMDIRGAGNLLGEEQSGHIREVGVELYQQMLEEAVADARSGRGAEQAAEDSWSPQINLGMPVLIPESYVPDLNVRLTLYRRVSDLTDRQEIDAFAAELIDRFGPLPEEVDNLLRLVEIKRLCKEAGVANLDAGPKGAVVGFRNNSFRNPARLVDFMQKQAGTAKLRPDHKLVLLRPWDSPESRMAGVRQLMLSLAQMAAGEALTEPLAPPPPPPPPPPAPKAPARKAIVMGRNTAPWRPRGR
ncbi:transcription-repair coupling factor [Rhodospirillum centenum]|uniref:Transcription-repair-coupling factor n=1 Tax=Rhodospirillum centenum (strain ATCC 51521 / SW) TaxID=414684 RepID=B6ISZ9_RHOCS|nr:transcription-repair coupling factor [Rhodospirillum centenum]ACI98670.1 transcription-repair coupling factor [Rhodospirillum centenum SW]